MPGRHPYGGWQPSGGRAVQITGKTILGLVRTAIGRPVARS